MSSSTSTRSDPLEVLGLPRQASEAEIRARYLELVKQYPPDREPDKFREIRAAYEATKDPLIVAERLAQRPDDEVPAWTEVIEAQKKNTPKLAVSFLVSLGNRDVPPSPGS